MQNTFISRIKLSQQLTTYKLLCVARNTVNTQHQLYYYWRHWNILPTAKHNKLSVLQDKIILQQTCSTNITTIYEYCTENCSEIPQYYYLHVILRNSNSFDSVCLSYYSLTLIPLSFHPLHCHAQGNMKKRLKTGSATDVTQNPSKYLKRHNYAQDEFFPYLV